MAKYILGSKKVVTFEDFDHVRKNIEQYISREEADAKVNQAVEEVLQLIAGGKRAGYCWSGGKDSLALQVVMERAGVKQCVLCTCHEMSPAVLQWSKDNAPEGLQIYYNATITIPYIRKHIDRVFPQTNKDRCWWMKQLRWNMQKKFVRDNRLDVCFWGRRSQDKNMCYKNGSKSYYDDKIGAMHSNIIAEWKHEDVIAVIHYFLGDNFPFYYDHAGFNGGMPEHGFWFEKHSYTDAVSYWPELKSHIDNNFPELISHN